jgi:hypothetical protein
MKTEGTKGKNKEGEREKREMCITQQACSENM